MMAMQTAPSVRESVAQQVLVWELMLWGGGCNGVQLGAAGRQLVRFEGGQPCPGRGWSWSCAADL